MRWIEAVALFTTFRDDMGQRDDFSAKTIERMRTRVAFRCSNPDCRRQTAGPSATDAMAVAVLGVAAHIHAAAPGGPRYLAAMSSGERRSIANGLWLCSGCGTLVDRDPVTYPAERLRQWKTEAERLAAQENNQRLPASTDAQDQLVAALSGHAPRFLPQAISNAHRASTSALERLDPRFEVGSKHEGTTTTFTLNAREPVSLGLAIRQDRREAWARAWTELVLDGTPIEMDGAGVTFTGSPLMESLFGQAPEGTSRLCFVPNERPVRVKLTAVERSGRRHSLDDVSATLRGGARSFQLAGALWDGLAAFELHAKHQTKPWSGRVHMAVDYTRWVGKDLRRLPYLSAILSFFRWADEEARLELILLEEGETRAQLWIDFKALMGNHHKRHGLLEYLADAGEVLRAVSQTITLPGRVAISPADAQALEQAHMMVVARRWPASDVAPAKIRFPLEADADGANIVILRAQSQPSVIRFDQTEPFAFSILGQLVTLPLMTLTIDGMIPRVMDDRDTFEAGEQVEVELERTEAFAMTFAPSA